MNETANEKEHHHYEAEGGVTTGGTAETKQDRPEPVPMTTVNPNGSGTDELKTDTSVIVKMTGGVTGTTITRADGTPIHATAVTIRHEVGGLPTATIETYCPEVETGVIDATTLDSQCREYKTDHKPVILPSSAVFTDMNATNWKGFWLWAIVVSVAMFLSFTADAFESRRRHTMQEQLERIERAIEAKEENEHLAKEIHD